MIQQLETTPGWDICIIGGGATGLGVAVDAASRGFKTILLEQHDFAKGTSSRSTKLVHGGVRYLQQGNVKLVMEALKERGLLLKNAPHLVKNQLFIVPNYKWWEGPFYGIGLKIYDWMAGKLNLGPSQFLTKDEILELVPTLNPDGLRGGISYHDGQFDDARLAINLAQTAVSQKAAVINYMQVTGFLKLNDKIYGVRAKDTLHKKEYELKSKVVINATGIFTDIVLNYDDKEHEHILTLSQGIHIVLDKKFLPGKTAIMVPQTDDGRVLFAVPWYDKIIIGTTDTPVDTPSLEPVALEEEIDFILKHIGRYFTKDPQHTDIRSVFAGLRPLIKGNARTTAALSREHLLNIAESGLITITGGKWTTYRRMAEDVINLAIKHFLLDDKECQTEELRIHGWKEQTNFSSPLYYFGADEKNIIELTRTNEWLAERIHPQLTCIKAEIVWAVQEEMCMTVEDFLSRRTRALLLDAKAAIEAAPVVAAIMAKHMNKNENWISQQIADFNSIAKNYLWPVADDR